MEENVFEKGICATVKTLFLKSLDFIFAYRFQYLWYLGRKEFKNG